MSGVLITKNFGSFDKQSKFLKLCRPELNYRYFGAELNVAINKNN